MLSGAGLAFTRAIAEYGSTNLITGNIPLQTQVASVNIVGRIESDNTAAAAAVSTALLVVAFVVLVGLDLVQRWGRPAVTRYGLRAVALMYLLFLLVLPVGPDRVAHVRARAGPGGGRAHVTEPRCTRSR